MPKDYAPKGARLWDVVAHSQAAVQFNHRIGGYLLFLAAVAFAVVIWRTPRTLAPIRRLSLGLAGLVTAQAALGVLTLMLAAPLALSLTHQLGAVVVLATAIVLAWRVQRN
jgi:cytochrome c oxidase assembly protein subunit 15